MSKACILGCTMFGLFTAGCATQPLSPAEQAFDSCFVSRDADGWSFSDESPANGEQLKKLIERDDHELRSDDREYWFGHEDGRKMLCVISPFGDPPVYCSGITYQLEPTDDGWVVGETVLMLCHLKP